MKKKICALAGILACLACSGCGVFEPDEYPTDYKNLVVKKADAYIEETYGDIFGNKPLTCYGFSVEGLTGSQTASLVTYCFDDKYTFHIWNSLTYPIDDIAYEIYSAEAGEKIKRIAEEIFGTSVEFEPAQMGYYVNSIDNACADVDEFLSREDSYIFLIAIADDIPDKVKVVERFCDRLREQGINSSFGIYFYEDYSNMLKDFQADKALGGRGDFINWVFCKNCNQEVELRGKGISYRQSSKQS